MLLTVCVAKVFVKGFILLECLWQQQQCKGGGVLGVRDSVGTGIIILKITCDRHIMKSHTLTASSNHRRG